ncbi:MAG: HD domain-containing protein [Firmicutes bacterium]|nr:HD domain-containing protein [Bacillota bacterium]MCM1400503.1 HD domain-containing protein [Bacteroides sp.]MCM1476869.1 HD domain-containing protein [Bacteroides sp.]
MENLTTSELARLLTLYRAFRAGAPDLFDRTSARTLLALVKDFLADEQGPACRDKFGLHPLLRSLATATALCTEVSADRNMVTALLLSRLASASHPRLASLDPDVLLLMQGLEKVQELYSRHTAVANENFRNLMLTFAADIRVIIMMIVDRLVLMRAINHHPDQDTVREVAREGAYLYAQLAHRLGLYKIKGELEDMSLKYTNREMFTRIARKLNETKRDRDDYMVRFITPVKAALEAQGLKFDIKGRTKSIYSIWNKMVKQHTDVDGIYDLFAIRIILDVPPERERAECWLAFSVITDMFQPNPARMKDWLSVPKSNGYESLHITVLGPADKWVEVQIRSRRMDEIAETGVAAHWKYKGIKSENNLDTWMNHVRDILEDDSSGPMELMKNMKMDLYNKEVFVFTPRGDLYKLPLGATVLDFAFNIHSNLGCVCTGAKVNGKTRKINHKLQSGDTVEVLTGPNQMPKLDWLSQVVTSKARNKIRQALKERDSRDAELAKEMLLRRFKNRKVELAEPTLMKMIKRLGFKAVTDFYKAIAAGELDVNDVVSEYEAQCRRDEPAPERVSAEEFTLSEIATQSSEASDSTSGDVLIIGNNVKGMNYRFSKCCNPIFGDKVFGFVSAEGVIKIHRTDCPNAPHILQRYPYRVIATRWSGKSGSQFVATLTVVGTDDIGIVTNISSIINKQSGVSLRNISIDSHDGLFHGYLVVGVDTTETLKQLINKISTVKGVKNVQRSN